MELSEEVAQVLLDTVTKCNAADDEFQKEREAVSATFRKELESLLQERQPLLEKLDWSAVFDASDAPTKEFLNGTTDTKLLRAVTSLKVETTVTADNKIVRKVIVTLRPNMFIDNTELHRTIDSDMKTTSASGVNWKSGTEKSRGDSIFRFFETVKDGVEVLVDAVDAFEAVYQNPYIYV